MSNLCQPSTKSPVRCSIDTLTAQDRYKYLLALAQYSNNTANAQQRLQQQRQRLFLQQYNNNNNNNNSNNVVMTASLPSQPTSLICGTSARNGGGADLLILRKNRSRFVLFVKVLFQHLAKSNDDFLITQARKIIQSSVHHKSYTSLEYKLRECVGESHWRRTQKLTMYYLRRQRLQKKNIRKVSDDRGPKPNIAHSA